VYQRWFETVQVIAVGPSEDFTTAMYIWFVQIILDGHGAATAANLKGTIRNSTIDVQVERLHKQWLQEKHSAQV
jgi:hypothetical protein